jgi:archaemetzincin
VHPGLQIALIPVGEVDQAILSLLKVDLLEIFSADIEVYPALPLGPDHFAKDRGQYLADGLLDAFSRVVPMAGTLLLGITETDLFSPGMNFVFGIANRGRALISTFRLRPEFFGQGPNPKVFRRRVLTEAVHELGHALGLPHCEYPGCVMYFSNWIGDTDRKGPGFCFMCARTLERMMVTRNGHAGKKMER